MVAGEPSPTKNPLFVKIEGKTGDIGSQTGVCIQWCAL
jgi:hypothetical protein